MVTGMCPSPCESPTIGSRAHPCRKEDAFSDVGPARAGPPGGCPQLHGHPAAT
jgi:hypothetical protein